VKRIQTILFLCGLFLLTGCSAILEREYSTVEPHSSKFWESGTAGITLRAENYQDIVNDLLILIGQHTESATLRLYDYEGDMSVTEVLEEATSEIQQETPLGAYAVEYITTSSESQRDYYEISVQISYRRTEEQIRAVINATSTDALSSLLETALEEEKPELVVRIGYWNDSSLEQIDAIVAQVREHHGLTEETPWLISCYPATGPAGLIEFLLDVPPEVVAALTEPQTPEEGASSETAEEGEIGETVSNETPGETAAAD
jgi:hypothetical protein